MYESGEEDSGEDEYVFYDGSDQPLSEEDAYNAAIAGCNSCIISRR